MNKENDFITTGKFILMIVNHSISKQSLINYDSLEEIVLEARKAGWLEEIDWIQRENLIEKKVAARIVHQYLKCVLKEPDESDWNLATQLVDLFDCHICVNHIAQVYVKGIMLPEKVLKDLEEGINSLERKPNKQYLFGMQEKITFFSAEQMIDKMFDSRKRIKVQSFKEEPGKTSVEEISLNKLKLLQEMEDSLLLVDVRTKHEYLESHFNQAIHIPMAQILADPQCVKELLLTENRSERKIVFYCDEGEQSRISANCLMENGLKNISYLGTKKERVQGGVQNELQERKIRK